MMKKITFEEAMVVAEKIKKEYKLGTSKCPNWFKNICIPMTQDGSFCVAICVPSWFCVPPEEAEKFLKPIDNVSVLLRVVSDPPVLNFEKKKGKK